MAIQLQLFAAAFAKKKQPEFMKTITVDSGYMPDDMQHLLSDGYIKQNGMLLLRQKMSAAYRERNWKLYLQLVRAEMDFKKGRIPFDQALKNIFMG